MVMKIKKKIDTQRYGVVIFLVFLIVFCGPTFAYGVKVSDRTPQVRDAIVAAAGVDTPAEVTAAHLSAITSLNLSSKQIRSLKMGDFYGLTSLEALFLNDNQLTDLPTVLFIRHPEGTARTPTAFSVSVFNGLTSLRKLHLHNNQLTMLPDAMFEGLTSLQSLYLHNNGVDPLEMSVSLEKVADGTFKAVVPTGAPFDLLLPLSITNGSLLGGATALRIPQGSRVSATFTVLRPPGANAEVSIDIKTLPGLPDGHRGYTLLKSTDLPLTLIGWPEINPAPVFTEGDTTTRTIAENTPANTNIGAPSPQLTRTTVFYSKAHN
jgi:hypothetical protein